MNVPKREGAQVECVPPWLRWALVFFIVTNIVSYIAATTITVIQIDKQIDALKGGNEDKIKELEARKIKLMVGTSVEVILDLVDLFNIFVGGYVVHVVYLAMKMLSVGMWAYTQTSIGHVALWIIPIGLAMVVVVILLEVFSHLRKCALVTLIVLACIAWIGIVAFRIYQITEEMNATKRMMQESPQGQQGRFNALISEHQTNRAKIMAGSICMIVFGTLGLVMIWINKFWIGLLFAVLQLLGIVLWTAKLLYDNIPLDAIFFVPLSYSVLTLAILVGFLIELYFSKGDERETKGKLKNKRKPRK